MNWLTVTIGGLSGRKTTSSMFKIQDLLVVIAEKIVDFVNKSKIKELT